MTRILSIAIVVACFVQPLTAQTLRKPSYVELFDAVWQTINQNFYDPSFGGVDWKAMRAKYAPQVANVTDDRSFLDLAYRMMGELHASHLELVPSQAPQTGIGIRAVRLDGNLIIKSVA